MTLRCNSAKTRQPYGADRLSSAVFADKANTAAPWTSTHLQPRALEALGADRLCSARCTDTVGTKEPWSGAHLQRRALEAVQRIDVRLVLQQPLADLVRALARRQVQRRALVIVAALLVGDLPRARGRGCRCAAAERPCLQRCRPPRPERLSRLLRRGSETCWRGPRSAMSLRAIACRCPLPQW